MFNRECPRCQGTGRFDRGVCFQCKGKRFIKQKSKPTLPERNLVVTFDTGKQDHVKMYFFTREYAMKAVEHQMLVRGWKGTIAEVAGPTYAELYAGDWEHPTVSGHG